ncbi:MAG: hypothetical protein EAZ08_07590 [Cytophagales bacterium]|nr:MAG: hypothetical protein EAZ08_07590 [Cytophagales bacterium]
MDTNIDSIFKFLQENRLLVGYILIGVLFLILLVFLLIKNITSGKQPAVAGSPQSKSMASSSSPLPKAEQKNTPYFVAEQPDTKVFIDQLKKVSDESQKVIYKLDTEIATKENIIAEKTRYIENLEQQINEMPVEQMLNQQSEKLKKESERKLTQAKQEALSKAYQMWFFGFLIGIVVAIGIGAAYYYLVLKG